MGGHAPHGKPDDDLLGEQIPDHAKPSLARALRAVAVWLPLWLGQCLLFLLRGPEDIFTRLSVFFSEVAVVSFGGAYAVLAYVAQQAVETHHWLRPGEMLAGLGMAETTPGPLIMVVQYVGFLAGYRAPGALPPLLSATLAGLLVTWVTFTPCFLWVFLGAPYLEALRGVRALSAALSAVTAAVVGVILNLAVWFGIHVIFRRPSHRGLWAEPQSSGAIERRCLRGHSGGRCRYRDFPLQDRHHSNLARLLARRCAAAARARCRAITRPIRRCPSGNADPGPDGHIGKAVAVNFTGEVRKPMNSIDADRLFPWKWVGRRAARFACAAAMASFLLGGRLPARRPRRTETKSPPRWAGGTESARRRLSCRPAAHRSPCHS